MATIASRRRRPGIGTSVSVGLIIAVLVSIAVVLALTSDSDNNRTVRTNVNDAPLSYYVPEAGDGIVGGHDQAVVPAPRATTGEHQGDGLVNTADDLSVTWPTSRHHPYGGDVGLTDGSDSSAALEQAQRAHDEMLFEQWNDPLGWQAIPEKEAVVPYERWLFLEQNGVYDTDATRDLAVTTEAPDVMSYERQKFIEINTYLPGWTDDAPSMSDRQRFTEN